MQGVDDRIFYLMVPMGWLALFSFGLIFISSIAFLKTRNTAWDVVSYCAAELGIVTTTLALFVGMIWARPEWGVWWDWEPRLTATLVLWLIYVAYFMARSFAPDEARGQRFAAVVGIVGFVDVPMVALATTIWKGGSHPPLLVGHLPGNMAAALMLSIFAYTAIYIVLLSQRTALRKAELELRNLKDSEA
jgi:heme exporter protein C